MLLRALVGVAALGAALFNAALMLSDRAPRAARIIGGRFVERLSERIDSDGRVAQVAADPRLPENDALIHIGVWAVAMVLVGLAIWTWRGLLVSTVAVLGLSAVVELGQIRWTRTRTADVSDVLGNMVGIGAGAVFVAGCYLAWSAAAGFVSRLTGGRPRI